MINLKCHDLKHLVHGLHKNKTIDTNVLLEIEEAINIYGCVIKTGNTALDIVLTEKALLCDKNGITLSCIVDGKSLSFMADTDIYTLFGNALENAIDAVMKLNNADDRRISIRIKRVGELLTVHLENRFVGELSYDNNLPVTTKSDKKYHGYGIRSMEITVNKYNGTMRVGTRDEIFLLDLLFPISK